MLRIVALVFAVALTTPAVSITMHGVKQPALVEQAIRQAAAYLPSPYAPTIPIVVDDPVKMFDQYQWEDRVRAREAFRRAWGNEAEHIGGWIGAGPSMRLSSMSVGIVERDPAKIAATLAFLEFAAHRQNRRACYDAAIDVYQQLLDKGIAQDRKYLKRLINARDHP